MNVRRLVPSRMLPAIALVAWLALTALHGAIKTEAIPELKPPQGTLPDDVEQHSLWPLAIAGAGMVLGLILIWQKPTTRRAVETPYAQAMRELIGAQQPDAASIGSIVRRYIVQTFAAPGPGQTFEELAALLSRDPRWTPALQERLRLLIDPLEIAKFAPPGNPADPQRLRDDAFTLLTDLAALHRPPVISPA
jgi:hypothetical protein